MLYISNSSLGQTSRSASGVPSWNPAALLQPNHRAVSSPNLANSTQGQFSHPQSPLQQNQRMQQRPQMNMNMNMNMHNNSMVFQFSSPNDTPSAGPSSRSSTPGSSYANGFNGAGNFIERINNVQHRSVVPQPKRRRTEDSENGFHHIMTPQVHGGGGILGQYVTDRRKEANGATASPSMTVDLTEGKSRSKARYAGTFANSTRKR